MKSPLCKVGYFAVLTFASVFGGAVVVASAITLFGIWGWRTRIHPLILAAIYLAGWVYTWRILWKSDEGIKTGEI